MPGTKRPTPSWLTWLPLILGILLICGSLAELVFTSQKGLALWQDYKKLPADQKSSRTIAAAFGIGRDVLGLILGIGLVSLAQQKKTLAAEADALQSQAAPAHASAPKIAPRAPAKRWRSCNILHLGEVRQLWNFNAARNGFALNKETSIAAVDTLPGELVAKDWKVLFQPKLNVACLPIEKVFLRVLHLPAGSFEETLSMVDLQLEKISPLPTTQIVWSIELLPHHVETLQTVIVIIVARDLVEEFLGKLEGQGYLADRLEVPFLDQLLATPVREDGAWVFPGAATGKFTGLVAWWYGGVLRSLSLIHVPGVPERAAMLEEQLKQLAWTGELEGWLNAAPRWHLVADEVTGAIWQPMFSPWLGHSVEVQPTLPAAELATLTANRAGRAGVGANILPPEYSARYHQQHIDRLWMRGLFAVLGIYVLGVIVYMAISAVQEYRTEGRETEMHQMSATYTNTLQLKAQLQVLQDKEALKFAALDCWKATAELMPESITLRSLDFKNGTTIVLNGTAPADQAKLVTDFNEALRRATNDDQPLFQSMELPISKLDPGGSTLSWSFSGELMRGEAQ